MAQVRYVEKPPEGGWGWVVVAATFFIHIVAIGSTKSFGVFYAEFRDVFQESAGLTSFISSLLGASVLMCSPFASALSNLTSCRTVVIAGGVISALGLIISYFAQTMIHLFFALGILTGFGFSLMYSPSLAMVGRYFERLHATANGIAICGVGVGIFALPPLFQFLIDEFGWRGALLILAGLVLNGCVCGALLRPIHLREGRNKEQVDRDAENQHNVGIIPVCRKIMEMFDVSLLRERSFLLYCISIFGTSLGNSLIYVHLVAHAQNLGVEKTQAAFLMSVMGATEAISRPLNGWLSDRGKISKVYYYMIGLVGLSVANVAIPFGSTYTGLVVCMVVYGFFSGIIYPLLAVLVRKYSGVSRISGGLAWAFVFQGTAVLIGGPIAGWLYDATGNYNMSFYSAGIFIFLSVIVLLPNPCSTTRKTLGSGSGELPDHGGEGAVGLKDFKPKDGENGCSDSGQSNPGFQTV